MFDLVFSAKTSGSEEWKAVISAVSTLVEEATFEATVEGISFRGMDPSHVALIDINWPNTAFERFECDGDIKTGSHPKIFLNVRQEDGKIECYYCGKTFIWKSRFKSGKSLKKKKLFGK